MDKFISNSENETSKIAYDLASTLNTGDILILSGDLGSGKTHFTKGLLSFWELDDEASSPTFTIVNEHHANNTNIYHFDVYRLSGPGEFENIGGPEYFENGICIIEWGEIIKDSLPASYIQVTIEKDLSSENVRHISIERKP